MLLKYILQLTFHGNIQPQVLYMAYYKFSQFLEQNDDQAFDLIHQPGSSAPYSGIYRCEGCGHEITSVAGRTLPPQNHHQHTGNQGTIRWRLIIATTHNE
jgi:hypothetical protein